MALNSANYCKLVAGFNCLFHRVFKQIIRVYTRDQFGSSYCATLCKAQCFQMQSLGSVDAMWSFDCLFVMQMQCDELAERVGTWQGVDVSLGHVVLDGGSTTSAPA